jgi:hypothetical protein
MFGVGKKIMDEHFGSFPCASLFYNERRKTIGIKPDQKHEDSYNIRYANKGSTGASFTGIGFLKYHGIDYSTSRFYRPQWNKKESMLEIDLNTPLDF